MKNLTNKKDHNAISPPKITFIGFGEAAMAFAKGLKKQSFYQLKAFDIKTTDENERKLKLADYKRYDIDWAENLKIAIQGADLVFSFVTADQASEVAQSVAQHIKPSQFYLDCNSCSPDTKKLNATLIEKNAAFYVDVAVMSPVLPKYHQTPLYISGSHSHEVLIILDALSMDVTIIEGGVGKASVIKMIRSIMIKGFEALNAECLLSARKAGVEQQIITSLSNSMFPNFEKNALYMLQRMTKHGLRRAAEMREVSITLAELDLPREITEASVSWQQQLGSLTHCSKESSLTTVVDNILFDLSTLKK